MDHSLNQHKKEHWLHTFHSRPSSAVIILEDDEERVLIVKANYKEHWTFPGGVIDLGETPMQAAIREIKEEVGLDVSADSLTFGWVTARHSTSIDTYQFIFKASLRSDAVADIVLQASEIDEWRLVTKKDVLSNDIHYAKAVQLWAQDNRDGYIEQTFGVND